MTPSLPSLSGLLASAWFGESALDSHVCAIGASPFACLAVARVYPPVDHSALSKKSASPKPSSIRWRYTRSVNAGSVCPSHSWTCFGVLSAANSGDAQVWRNVWNVTHGTPAASVAGSST
jgi:hypothetical protein